MEFKDRKATNPGRIKLKNIATNVTETYDIELADGAVEAGTPLNKATFDAFKEDILNLCMGENSSAQGGGFAGKINGADAKTQSIYAPTAVGTKGYFLQSNGSGAPTWNFPFAVSGKPTPYDSTPENPIILPSIGAGKIGIDVRSCVNADTEVTIDLPAGGTYRYVYVITDPSNTSQETTKTGVGVNTKAAGGTNVCTIGGSDSCMTVQTIYYRVS